MCARTKPNVYVLRLNILGPDHSAERPKWIKTRQDSLASPVVLIYRHTHSSVRALDNVNGVERGGGIPINGLFGQTVGICIGLCAN